MKIFWVDCSHFIEVLRNVLWNGIGLQAVVLLYIVIIQTLKSLVSFSDLRDVCVHVDLVMNWNGSLQLWRHYNFVSW